MIWELKMLYGLDLSAKISKDEFLNFRRILNQIRL